MKMIRKNLWIPALLSSIKNQLLKKFNNCKQHLNTKFSDSDCILSGIALYHLKYSSLLQFNRDKNQSLAFKNFKNLYLVNDVPSDTRFRDRLDEIDSNKLKTLFGHLISKLQDSKVLSSYKLLDKTIHIAMDGTGHYHSTNINCENCCTNHHKDDKVSYYHDALSAVIVSPYEKVVFPIGVEAIKKEDGSNKNDCELNAGKRLIQDIRTAHPSMNIRIILDALYLNGPFINKLINHNIGFIITAKESHQKYLFNAFNNCDNKETHIIIENNIEHRFQYAHDLPLNHSHQNILLTFINYQSISITDNKILFASSWATDVKVNKDNILLFTQVARSRWHIENQTFNSLKNQGYNFEHNFGHGKKNLCTNMLILMFIAFAIDQIQQATSKYFQKALEARQSKKALWCQAYAKFTNCAYDSWQTFYEALSTINITFNTS